jgi:16S rRNA processing protein RimM
LISFGKILKIKGNKGEIVIGLEPYCDNLSLKKDQVVILKSEKYIKKQKIEYSKRINSIFILKFYDVNTIEEAYKLIGYSVFILDKIIQEEDKSMIHFLVRDIHEKLWGTVRDIKQFGLNKVFEISNNEEIIYIPFSDEIIHEIRMNEGLIIIDPPEGLWDLNK